MSKTTENDISLRKLWIGNLDPKLTEFQILKFFQKCGDIEKFDLPYVRDGKSTGLHKGYAFITYKSSRDARHALTTMNGKIIMGRIISVNFARIDNAHLQKNPNKQDLKISAITGGIPKSNTIGRETVIRAIESKLKLMEHQDLDVNTMFNKTVSHESNIVKNYQSNLNTNTTTETKSSFDRKFRSNRCYKPYSKKKS